MGDYALVNGELGTFLQLMEMTSKAEFAGFHVCKFRST